MTFSKTILKSDYVRIEIALLDFAILARSDLKSDYVRIEMNPLFDYDFFKNNLKIRLC